MLVFNRFGPTVHSFNPSYFQCFIYLPNWVLIGLLCGCIQLQTKYTSIHGQDPERIPYDPAQSITKQVESSVQSSLNNLSPKQDDDGQSYLDSLILHSPLPTLDETLEAWRAMETFVPHKVRNLGVSNCNLLLLMELCSKASIKPAVVQNRFYPSTKYDVGLRKFCQENHIVYQSFWTLTANPNLLKSADVVNLAREIQISPQTAFYCLVLGLENLVVLNGTQSEEHMEGDLAAVQKAHSYASLHPQAWNKVLESFKKSIGQPLDL